LKDASSPGLIVKVTLELLEQAPPKEYVIVYVPGVDIDNVIPPDEGFNAKPAEDVNDPPGVPVMFGTGSVPLVQYVDNG
jgi:hypothetical protein